MSAPTNSEYRGERTHTQHGRAFLPQSLERHWYQQNDARLFLRAWHNTRSQTCEGMGRYQQSAQAWL